MDGPALKELDLAALKQDLPAVGLEAGDIGTIVFVHEQGRAYEVEFVAGNGQTIAVETLKADQIERLGGAQILHARPLTKV